MVKNIGYLRVSTDMQDIEKDADVILQHANRQGIGPIEFVKEIASGATSWKKRKIGAVVESLKKGDSIFVTEISRLGRRMYECMEILGILARKKVSVYAVRENVKLDDSLNASLYAFVFSLVAEMERRFISDRTKTALAAKKAQGVRLGRPRGPGRSKIDRHREQIILLYNDRVPIVAIAQKFECSAGTVHNWLGKHNLKYKKADRQKEQK